MKRDYEEGFLVGKLDEIEKRLDFISNRIDQHISSCSTRYFGLISGVVAIGTFLLAAAALLIGQLVALE